ncbi:MAG: hypothetical protein ACI841_003210, partial [Planctomycetota bacterium]
TSRCAVQPGASKPVSSLSTTTRRRMFAGSFLNRAETTIEGSRVYVESWVIKFEDEFVEQGDHLRGSSLVLFKRLFGDQQEPASGTTIDAVGSKPRIYGDEDGPSPEHAELWERFWDYANDPAAAAKKGVRAMHGEAPFTELRPGGSYKVELRASDGLTISPE